MHYPRVSLYALMLATAGMPLYIHLPRFAAVELGISLTALGSLLLILRMVDVFQDPVLGVLIDRFPAAQPAFANAAALSMALGFPLLFSLQAGMNWAFVALLIILFTGYSLGSILIYGRSASLARSAQPNDLLRLASWREGGQLVGVILAAALPSFLLVFGAGPDIWFYFGLCLGGIACLAAWFSRTIWRGPVEVGKNLSLQGLKQAGAMKLLLLMLLNSLPVALTSTLFLFFAEDHLGLSGQAGLFLLAFFLSAGLSIPFWSQISTKFGNRNTLVLAMGLAIISFFGAAFLMPGDRSTFLLICVASGFAMGADILILPLMFSKALIAAGLKAASAFGYWSFAGKLALALAAAIALPLLDFFNFTPGATLNDNARNTLVFAYAILPCALKLIALCFTLTLPQKDPLT
ncbi:MFS transporter [Cochlodiniinecator piscidefendens]|uniref:MFS transporter n=1 Tax=Cochlodiniinecator piscidefendens TaxID=2715756 RepID=UPI00140DF146|nr:MFS transporter [Cochlodiniinecator piscidefendens]